MKDINKSPIWNNVVCSSVIGADHAQKGTVCQDAVSVKEGSYRGDPYLICSVADGHGGSAYVHSERGSALSALSAEQAAIQFMLAAAGKRKKRGRHFEQHVVQHLKAEWIRNITQACQSYRITQQIIRKYGSTLLSVLIYRDQAYIAQLGDGDICVVDRKGTPAFMVEPEDGPTSSITASLCSTDANKHWRFACMPANDIGFLMMSSDGLINSLASNDEYLRLATILADYMHRFPSTEVKAVLPQWLADYSKRGSGDDISLVAIHMKPTRKDTGENK